MPIEIRELIIKATVSPDDGSSAGPGPKGSGNSSAAAEEIITACVEKVMEILKDKDER